MKQDGTPTDRGVQIEPKLQRSPACCQKCDALTVSVSLRQWGAMATEKGKKDARSKTVRMRGVRGYGCPPITTVCLEALGAVGWVVLQNCIL